MGDWTPLGPVVCMVDDVGDSSGGEWYGTDVWVAIGRVRERESERRGWKVRGKWSGRVEGKEGRRKCSGRVKLGQSQTRGTCIDGARSNVRGGMRKCLAVIVE